MPAAASVCPAAHDFQALRYLAILWSRILSSTPFGTSLNLLSYRQHQPHPMEATELHQASDTGVQPKRNDVRYHPQQSQRRQRDLQLPKITVWTPTPTSTRNLAHGTATTLWRTCLIIFAPFQHPCPLRSQSPSPHPLPLFLLEKQSLTPAPTPSQLMHGVHTHR